MLENLFRPKSVAIIGASREPQKVGFAVLKNMLEAGFKGELFPINPKADKILGQRGFHNFDEIQKKS